MNIAFVSSSVYPDIVKKVVDEEFSYLNVTYLTYKDHTEIAGVLDERQKDFDAVLFSGLLAYHHCCAHCRRKVPWMVVRSLSSHMASTLRKADAEGYDISRVSVDSISLKEVKNAFAELGESVRDDSVFCLEPTTDDFLNLDYSENVTAFHVACVEKNGVTCCLTSALKSYEKLRAMGIPTVFIEASFDTFRRAFYELYLQVSEGQNRQSQIVVIAAEMQMPGEDSIVAVDDLNFVKSRLRMAEKVYSFASRLQGIVSETACNQYLIIAAKSDFSAATQDFNQFELFEELSSDVLTNTHLGIGMGKTASQARQHAHAALERARLRGNDTACLVDSLGETVLFTSFRKTDDRDKYLEDEKIVRLARRSKISVRRMYQLYDVFKKSKKASFTSQELSELLGISKRNMDRLLSRLEAAELVRVVGMKSGDGFGRPSRLIQLSLSYEE